MTAINRVGSNAPAARHTPVPADTATVIFGNHVRPITHPGTAPTTVTEFRAYDGWENVPTAIDAHQLTDPATTAQAIGRAATAALRAAAH